MRDSAMACCVNANIYTIHRLRHESAASRGVVYFVIAIGLSILIEDKTRHFRGPSYRRGRQLTAIAFAVQRKYFTS